MLVRSSSFSSLTTAAEQKVQAKRMQLLKKNKFLRQHHLLSDTAAEKSGANGHNHDRHESPAATAAPAVSASAAAEKKHAVQKSAAPTTLEKSRTSHKPHTAPSAVAAKLVRNCGSKEKKNRGADISLNSSLRVMGSRQPRRLCRLAFTLATQAIRVKLESKHYVSLLGLLQTTTFVIINVLSASFHFSSRADREASAASAPVQETREEREARLKRSREQRKATYKKLTARTKKYDKLSRSLFFCILFFFCRLYSSRDCLGRTLKGAS